MNVDPGLLAEFTLETVQYDGWIELTHHFQRCDWTEDVSLDSLLTIVWKAAYHEGNCGGIPQPRTPVAPSPDGDLVPKLWSKEYMFDLSRTPVPN